MSTQRPQLVNGEIYHIILRAVGDALVFNDEKDYYRGIFSLYEFNNTKLVEIRKRREERKKEKTSGCPTPADRELLVEILAFCFMPNHIHLLVRQLKDNGISQFMQKVGGGYANYFNKKYGRKGHLFNRFKAVLIKTDEQLQIVFVYIHANPISLIEPGWKENGIKKQDKVINFLEEEYRWSSFFDYLGKKNFSSVTERDFILEAMSREQGCREAVENWIKHKKETRDFGDIVLE
ncbi:MAG: transposase [bacterium]|nr:transposase [bacterium]